MKTVKKKLPFEVEVILEDVCRLLKVREEEIFAKGKGGQNLSATSIARHLFIAVTWATTCLSARVIAELMGRKIATIHSSLQLTRANLRADARLAALYKRLLQGRMVYREVEPQEPKPKINTGANSVSKELHGQLDELNREARAAKLKEAEEAVDYWGARRYSAPTHAERVKAGALRMLWEAEARKIREVMMRVPSDR